MKKFFTFSVRQANSCPNSWFRVPELGIGIVCVLPPKIKFKGTGSRKNGFLLQENCVAGRRNGNKFAAHCFDVKQISHPVDIGLFSRYCPFTFKIEHFSWHYPIIYKPFRSIFLLFFDKYLKNSDSNIYIALHKCVEKTKIVFLEE